MQSNIKKTTDEDKMIKKLEEHRDTIKMVEEIGKLHDIDIQATANNDSSGDFTYPKDKEDDLIKALDKHIGKYKYIQKEKDGE